MSAGLLLGCGKNDKPAPVKGPPAQNARQLQEAFNAAIWKNDKAEVDRLLQQGADVTGGGQLAPLRDAVWADKYDMAAHLISKGALRKENPAILCSILSTAAANGDAAMVKLLLENGANANGDDDRGERPLFWAAGASSKDAAEMLIARGADVNWKGKSGRTPLMQTSNWARSDVARLLISKGAKVNEMDSDGWTALDLCLWERMIRLRDFLEWDEPRLRISPESAVASLDAIDRGGQTDPALEKASQSYRCYARCRELVSLLRDSGAQVDVFSAAMLRDAEALAHLLREDPKRANAVGNESMAPLHLALLDSRSDPKPVMELLLAAGANPNAKNESGDTPLMMSIKFGRRDLVEALIAKGAKPDEKGSTGRTPLRLAASQGHVEIAELLISKGANVNALDDARDTPLIAAVAQGRLEIAELLISKGADVNAFDGARATALIAAVRKNRTDMAAMLISKGAQVDALDARGKTPLTLAAENDQKDMVELLKKHGGNATAELLVRAVQRGDRPTVDRLLVLGVDINGKGDTGRTPLTAALEAGQTEMAQYLMDRGADLNAPDAAGNTPLSAAIKSNKPDIVKLLKNAGAKE
jgi:ankyrin repeat protein